ncbi:MAG: C40 family peptidase [Bacteroidales bacterium]|nr:C40 family peptidase [Bacteroidales bacterium]
MTNKLTTTLIICSLLLLSGCASQRVTSSAYSVSKKTSKSPISKTTSDIPKSGHEANCRKLNVSSAKGDNTKLYAECASWMGVAYKYGGTNKSGVDCSGLTYLIYKAVYGKTLTRQSSGMLSDNCKRINKSQLQEGDLVFFRTDGKKTSTPNHVGIYLKQNKFIHASTSKGVIVSDLNQDYYIQNWITGGRVK